MSTGPSSGAAPQPRVPRARTARPGRRAETYAHRGSSGSAPENTTAAFLLAIAEGADHVETDVQLSADGELVIIHDVTLVRTTDARRVFPDRAPWRVHDFTLAELRMLDAGGWYDGRFGGERIPTLDEVLDLLDGQVGLNLELKSPDANPGLVAALAARLRTRREWVGANRLVVGSFDRPALRDLHARLPDVAVSLISYEVPTGDELADLAGWVCSVNPDVRRLHPEDADRVTGAGLALVPWTVDAPRWWRWALDLGVTGMITNYPAALAGLLDGRDPVPGGAGVVIEDVAYDSPGQPVLLRNVSERPVDVGGWYLRNQASERIPVGHGGVVAPGGRLRVPTGPGAVWNKAYGDSAGLHRADGTLVDLYAYVVGGGVGPAPGSAGPTRAGQPTDLL
ncbi:glycerophosphodiester phosphodiesterase family protein [Micromonospora auratinigra]|uniref:Glycerophosphoryl diester phosphodiesterase n=1 Tax=Micromonospora auratinigra TaxID=261654 RepID=A0A1A8ZAK0_9ACTN|nr:glycerophosphodiester phosphodiesterase family protein [Micromonospora auratinigra]SBT40900.1 glycerophosphoryl diester phosphodiesterase [Micromonospora auratinigra]